MMLNAGIANGLRRVVQGAWRRRLLLVTPLLVMLPLALLGVKFLPKKYVATSLAILQESSRGNPLNSGSSTRPSMQEHIAGLQALLLSEHVLTRAVIDLEGEHLRNEELAMRTAGLRTALSLHLIGNDFLEFRLAGDTPDKLGERLETVMAHFLEALLEQGGLSASQLLLDRRREDLSSAQRVHSELRKRVDAVLPADQNRLAQLREFQRSLVERAQALAAVDAEVSKLRESSPGPGRLGGGSEQTGEPVASLPGDAPSDSSDGSRRSEASKLQEGLSRRAILESEVRDLMTSIKHLQSSLEAYNDLKAQLDASQLNVQAAEERLRSYTRYASLGGSRGPTILNAPERIRILDRPRDPQFPTASHGFFFLFSILAAALLGGGLAVAAELLDQRVYNSYELSALTGLPVLGRLPAYAEPDEESGQREMVDRRKVRVVSIAAAALIFVGVGVAFSTGT